MLDAREKLKRRLTKTKIGSTPTKSNSLEEEEKKEQPKSPRRNWVVSVSDKVDAKALKKINVNEDAAATQINLEAEMEKYLGGDDEVLKGFYESDDEIQFDSINPDSQASAAGQSFFGRITSAF